MNSFGTNQLIVAHRLKDEAGHGMPQVHTTRLQANGFYLNTCLRELAIMPDAIADNLEIHDRQMQWHSGRDAYSFLLQTATGLNSNIPGETNILGQFKHAWHKWRQQSASEQVCRLHAVMHRLFTDSKQIRHEFLRGIGGNSYGSLTRKLLSPPGTARILFVGTGKLAGSMAPFFDAYETAAWNHTEPGRLDSTQYSFSSNQAAVAANWATHLVITSPADTVNDQLWFDLTQTKSKAVIHLGIRRAERGVWAAWPGPASFFDLDDLFELRNHQSSVRSLQIRRARDACDQLAENTIYTGAAPTDVQRVYA